MGAQYFTAGSPAPFATPAAGSVVTFTVNGVAAAPEPASWVLMLLGVAGVYGRRRHSIASAALAIRLA